jgi:hypothetical protein
MAITLGAGSLTFADGTVQSTKTPTVVSAFTNDSGYVKDSDMSPVYAQRTGNVPPLAMGAHAAGTPGLSAAASIGIVWESGHGIPYLQWYNYYGTLQGTTSSNCNCNC